MDRENSREQTSLQQALRLASRGPGSTLLHLLFPICLVLGFSSTYLIPLFIAYWLEPLRLTEMIQAYLRWGLPVPAITSLVAYYWARKRLLAPYLKEVMRKQHSAPSESPGCN